MDPYGSEDEDMEGEQEEGEHDMMGDYDQED
eukprot:CAMPEP_0116881764 /NCGR_PEP_ID=MMETSP0463-20121206/13822_1 /TAXON_ID=181622 /ORGANISM="Strombidinopsis sp, Strain SopsisLIS2011" /LENGTH=30 /DNA_ID= /DNA_START= /DNA_END= /DNA_ORIENTATION=